MRGSRRSAVVPGLAAVMLAAALPASAVQVVGGFKGGWTLTDIGGDTAAEVSSTSAGVIGGILGWEINPWFTAQIEPVFIQKGAELENFDFGEFASLIKLDYFEIPLLAKFRYTHPAGTHQGPFGVVGPVFSINTRAALSVAGGDENIADHVRNAAFGLAFGGGYDIGTGNAVTTIDARYVVDFTEIFESDTPNPETTSDLRTRGLEITIGFYMEIN